MILVVFDLNGVLIDNRGALYDDAAAFLQWLNERPEEYCYAVWTSCRPHRAKQHLNQLTAADIVKPQFVYTRDHCLVGAEWVPPEYQPYGSIKDLRRLWNDHEPRWNKHNTVIFDDSAYKLRHQPDNLVLVQRQQYGKFPFVDKLLEWSMGKSNT